MKNLQTTDDFFYLIRNTRNQNMLTELKKNCMLFRRYRVRNGIGGNNILDEFARIKTETEKGFPSIFFPSALNSNHFSEKNISLRLFNRIYIKKTRNRSVGLRVWKKSFSHASIKYNNIRICIIPCTGCPARICRFKVLR